MRPFILLCASFSFLLLFSLQPALGQSTQFTYQGNLNNAGAAANGNYDFEFALFDAASGGTQIGSTLTRNLVVVAGGIFSVSLDFGDQYPGTGRFLEIRVRLSGGGPVTTLAPRQSLNSSPYSVKSLKADNATNSTNAVNAAQLGGIAAGNYLQSVTHNSTISGSGTAASPLSIALPLTLNGNSSFLPLVLVENTNGFGNSIYATVNGVNSDCPECAAIYAENTGHGDGLYGTTRETTDGSAGVKGESPGTGVIGLGGNSGVTGRSTNGVGVFGFSAGATGAGVYGTSTNAAGAGVSGSNFSSGPGVKGFSTSGFAGFFTGKGYFSDNLGVGTSNPAERLHVAGNGLFTGNLTVNGTLNGTASNALQLGGLAASQYVSTGDARLSDARIPTAGSSNYIQNTTAQQSSSNFNLSGNGVIAGTLRVGDNPSGFAKINVNHVNDIAIYATSTFGAGIDAYSYTKVGLNASGATFGVSGFGIQGGVKGTSSGGRAVEGSSTTGYGGYFESTSGPGVYAHSTSGYGISARSENTHAIYAEGSVKFTRWIELGQLVGSSGTHVCWDGTYLSNCSSSLRYKNNIGRFSGGLDVLRRLSPITFNWKHDGSHDLGLAAEDVEKIEPLLVTYNKSGEVEGVKYDRISVVLINAVKEQQAQIESLEKQNAVLQRQIEMLLNIVCSRKGAGKSCKGGTGAR